MENTKIEVPYHELSNYRIALNKYNSQWDKKKDKGTKLWENVLGNALRLAEAIDLREKKLNQAR
jgi:hypothetical protein